MQIQVHQVTEWFPVVLTGLAAYSAYLVRGWRSDLTEEKFDKLKEETEFKLELQKQLNALPDIVKKLETLHTKQHTLTSKLNSLDLLEALYQTNDRRTQALENAMADAGRRITTMEARVTDINKSANDSIIRLNDLDKFIREHPASGRTRD